MPGTSHGNLEQLLDSLSISELEQMKKLAQMDPASLEKILRDFGIHDTQAAIGALKLR